MITIIRTPLISKNLPTKWAAQRKDSSSQSMIPGILSQDNRHKIGDRVQIIISTNLCLEISNTNHTSSQQEQKK